MIRVSRKKAFKSALGSYKIFIDGVKRGKIYSGQIKEFEIENGRHIICAKMGWYKSNELCVDVSSSVVNIEAGNHPSRWIDPGDAGLLSVIIVIVALFVDISRRHDYLWLRVKNDTT